MALDVKGCYRSNAGSVWSIPILISLLFEEMLCHRPDGSGTQMCWACSLSESSRVSGNRDCGSVRWWHSGSAWCKTLLLLRKVASPRRWAILQGGWVIVLELCSGWGKKRLKPCTQYDIFWLSPKAKIVPGCWAMPETKEWFQSQ